MFDNYRIINKQKQWEKLKNNHEENSKNMEKINKELMSLEIKN